MTGTTTDIGSTTSIAFTPSGRHLAVGLNDGTIAILRTVFDSINQGSPTRQRGKRLLAAEPPDFQQSANSGEFRYGW